MTIVMDGFRVLRNSETIVPCCLVVTRVYRKLTHLRHFSMMDFPRVQCYL